MPQVKGIAILGLIKFIKKQPGDLMPKVKSMLPQDSIGYLDEHILMAKWYPYKLYVDMLKVLDNILGKENPEFCVEQGRLSARDNISTLYKVFIKFINIKLLLTQVMNMWNSYFDTGKVEVSSYTEHGKDRHLTIIIKDFPDIDINHVKSVMGWIEQFLIMSKFTTKVKSRLVKCQSSGDPITEMLFTED